MEIKWTDLKLTDEEFEEVKKVMESGEISGFSPKVKEFEPWQERE